VKCDHPSVTEGSCLLRGPLAITEAGRNGTRPTRAELAEKKGGVSSQAFLDTRVIFGVRASAYVVFLRRR